jgi:hypothetical protein
MKILIYVNTKKCDIKDFKYSTKNCTTTNNNYNNNKKNSFWSENLI